MWVLVYLSSPICRVPRQYFFPSPPLCWLDGWHLVIHAKKVLVSYLLLLPRRPARQVSRVQSIRPTTTAKPSSPSPGRKSKSNATTDAASEQLSNPEGHVGSLPLETRTMLSPVETSPCFVFPSVFFFLSSSSKRGLLWVKFNFYWLKDIEMKRKNRWVWCLCGCVHIDYRCEVGRFPVPKSCVTFSNPDLLSSRETGVDPGIWS